MTSPPSPKAGGKRAWLTLVLLILLFAGPMIAAWIAMQHEDLRPGRSSAKGHLMQPARPVSLAMLKGLNGAVMTPELLRGHWLLLYIADSTCGEVCRRSLYHMRQTRLAVGEDTHRVRRLLVLTDGYPRQRQAGSDACDTDCAGRPRRRSSRRCTAAASGPAAAPESSRLHPNPAASPGSRASPAASDDPSPRSAQGVNPRAARRSRPLSWGPRKPETAEPGSARGVLRPSGE